MARMLASESAAEWALSAGLFLSFYLILALPSSVQAALAMLVAAFYLIPALALARRRPRPRVDLVPVRTRRVLIAPAALLGAFALLLIWYLTTRSQPPALLLIALVVLPLLLGALALAFLARATATGSVAPLKLIVVALSLVTAAVVSAFVAADFIRLLLLNYGALSLAIAMAILMRGRRWLA